MTRTFVCRRADVEGGSVATARLEPDEFGRPRQAIVFLADGVLRAYLNLCRHLPIPLDAGSGDFFTPNRRKLRCGTHGALFRLDDGYCTVGPCKGERLLALPVFEEDGGIYVGEPI